MLASDNLNYVTMLYEGGAYPPTHVINLGVDVKPNTSDITYYSVSVILPPLLGRIAFDELAYVERITTSYASYNTIVLSFRKDSSSGRPFVLYFRNVSHITVRPKSWVEPYHPLFESGYGATSKFITNHCYLEYRGSYNKHIDSINFSISDTSQVGSLLPPTKLLMSLSVPFSHKEALFEVNGRTAKYLKPLLISDVTGDTYYSSLSKAEHGNILELLTDDKTRRRGDD